MLKLIIGGVVSLIFFSTLIIFIRRKPDIWFWIFLNLYFDPGGFIAGFMEGNLVGPLNVSDVLIVVIIICLITANVNWKNVLEDKYFSKFLFFLSIFFIYYFVVYGGIVPYFQNDLNYSTFLIKNRTFAYSFLIIITVYVFSLRSLHYFYCTTLIVGVICLTLFFVSLITGLKLIPIEEIARYTGDEMQRITILNYGLFFTLFPLSLITYLISRKTNLIIRYKKWLYYSGVIMLITMLITLTRRLQIDIIGTIFLTTLIISYIFRSGKLTSLLKVILPALLVLLVMYFILPKYVNYVAEISEDTFLLIVTGKDSRGASDYRVSSTGELDITKEYISKNWLFGTGYTYLYWTGPGTKSTSRGKKFASATDAAGEVPIYFLIFGFGITGAILMLPLYIIMANLFFKLIKLLRLTWSIYLQDPVTIILCIYILLSIAIKFSINLYAFSSDFRGSDIGFTMVLMGIGLALYRRLFVNAYRHVP